jgi:uncharacterized protein (TIGR02246 family)
MSYPAPCIRMLVLCLVLLAPAFGVASASGDGVPTTTTSQTPSPEVAAVHDQLRAVRDAIMAAWQRRDIDGVISHVDPDIVVTWQNGEVNRGPQAIRAFYEKMLHGESSVLSNIESTLTVDTLSILHGENTAIAYGSIHDDLSFRHPLAATLAGAGKTLSLDSRWTATLVRKAGEWKLASYHVSANLFSNPVTEVAVTGAERISGLTGFAVGVVLMLLLGWWFRGRAQPTAAPR